MTTLKTTARQRSAMNLRLRGWPLKRIARRLKITEGAVSQLLARARESNGLQPRARHGRVRPVAFRPLSFSIVPEGARLSIPSAHD